MSSNQDITSAFDRLAAGYDRHAALEQEAGRRLLERVTFRRTEPRCILDLGCGSGQCTAALKSEFRKAQVIGLDLSAQMLHEARRHSGLTRRLRLLRADMARLPLAARSVDMVFSNLATLWAIEPERLFAEVRRVLKPDGMFLFTGFGPDTLTQLAGAWAPVDSSVRLPVFPDLLETGDALTAAGFGQPVIDADRITLRYPSLDALMEELEATGMSLLVRGWDRWRERRSELADSWGPFRVDESLPLSFEIVYGVAFGPPEGQPLKTPEGDVATFSVDSLLKSRGMGYS